MLLSIYLTILMKNSKRNSCKSRDKLKTLIEQLRMTSLIAKVQQYTILLFTSLKRKQ